jgi:hypothetical protein
VCGTESSAWRTVPGVPFGTSIEVRALTRSPTWNRAALIVAHLSTVKTVTSSILHIAGKESRDARRRGIDTEAALAIMQRIRTDQEHTMPRTPYEVKFAGLLRGIAEAKAQGADVIMIHRPEVLGDTYAELIESLNRIAAAELRLMILPPNQRGEATTLTL